MNAKRWGFVYSINVSFGLIAKLRQIRGAEQKIREAYV